MKSSSGEYFLALDQVRALAVYVVFCWHFLHGIHGSPVPLNSPPLIFPLAILDQGNTGVAIFMTLSGYLFAKLLENKKINYGRFLWNRAVRLLPLLIVVFLLVGIDRVVIGHGNLYVYTSILVKGVVFPTLPPHGETLPHGAWSITTEFHYYLVLPFFLWLFRRSNYFPFLILILAILFRLVIFQHTHEIQSLSYLTIVGRLDQFLLGMIMFSHRKRFACRHRLVMMILCAFCIFWWVYDLRGGYYSYLSHSVLWVFLPTIEGIAYSIGIAWYDNSFLLPNIGLSKFIGQIGSMSYSLYLLHFFIVSHMANFVQTRIMDISNFYVACIWSTICFLLMVPLSYASFYLIEKPFLKLRKCYFTSPDRPAAI